MKSNILHETFIEHTVFDSEGKRHRVEGVMIQFKADSTILAVFVYSEALDDWFEIDQNCDSFKTKFTQEKIEYAIGDYWMNKELDRMNSWSELQLKCDQENKVG